MKKNKLNFNFIVAKALSGLNTCISLIVQYPISFYSECIINHNNSNNNSNSNNINNNGCISFIDYFLSSIVCLLFLLLTYYMFESYFIFLISFYISFLLSLLVYNNFNYSSLYIIRLNQKFAIIIITMFLSIIVVFYIMDYFSLPSLAQLLGLGGGNNINHILCEGSDSVGVSNSNLVSSNNSYNNSPNNAANTSVLSSAPSHPCAAVTAVTGGEGGSDDYVKKEDVIVTSKEVLDKIGEVVTTMVKDAVGPFIENIATAAGAGSAAGAIGGKIISSMPAGSSITHKVIAGAGAATITAVPTGGSSRCYKKCKCSI